MFVIGFNFMGVGILVVSGVWDVVDRDSCYFIEFFWGFSRFGFFCFIRC